jgi:hypothetical protein
MKKYFLLLIAVLSIAFYSCKKDQKPIPDPLIGSWFKQYLNPVTQNSVIDRYIFNPDGTFYFATSIHDKLTNAPISFIQTTTGSYKKDGNKLIFSKIVNKREESYKTDYSPQGTLFTLAETTEMMYSLSQPARFLYLTSPCPANALCAQVVVTYNRSATD